LTEVLNYAGEAHFKDCFLMVLSDDKVGG